MLQHIKLLTKIQTCNLFGLNEARYSSDSRKRNHLILMVIVWGILGLMLLFYVFFLTNAYINMNLADVVPIYLFSITSIVILFFSLFKAGSMIFQMKTYEMLIALPLSKASIVLSRFLTMYGGNFLLSLIIMIPGLGLYGWHVRPSVSFYILGLIGTVLLPLLPMTIATGIGALITAIGSRMKHKSIVISILSILFAIGVIGGNFWITANSNVITGELLQDLSLMISTQMGKLYPPALWFSQGLIGGVLLDFIIFVAVSIGIFGLVIWPIEKNFDRICRALNATSSKGHYQMEALRQRNLLMALCSRELKRYFASSIYVANTMMGYVMMVAAAVGLLVMGPESLENMLGMPGMTATAVPFVLAGLAGIGTTTSSSISLEGKQWWIIRSLPIQSKEIFAGKIMMNLIVAAPFYVITEVLVGIVLYDRATWIQLLIILLMPLVYIFWMAVVGLAVNLSMPVLEWENETTVVKQSGSSMITVLIGLVSVIVPVIFVMIMPSGVSNIISLAVVVGVGIATGFLYRKINKIDLNQIG